MSYIDAVLKKETQRWLIGRRTSRRQGRLLHRTHVVLPTCKTTEDRRKEEILRAGHVHPENSKDMSSGGNARTSRYTAGRGVWTKDISKAHCHADSVTPRHGVGEFTTCSSRRAVRGYKQSGTRARAREYGLAN